MARWSLHPSAQNGARVVLIPTSFGPDTQAPSAILTAGSELCGFEPILGVDVDALAVAQLPALIDEPPYSMCEAAVTQVLYRQQWPVLLPSTMAASWGAIRAFWKQYRSLTVVHYSAHANLIPCPEQVTPDQDTDYGAFAWVERLYQHQLCVVHVGLRSSSARAQQFLQDHNSILFLAQQSWDPKDIVAALPQQPVFLSLDCGVLDPAVLPTVMHPEPGGLTWNLLLQTCQAIFTSRTVVGSSLGGLTVASGTKQAARTVARLLNWLLACHALSQQKADLLKG